MAQTLDIDIPSPAAATVYNPSVPGVSVTFGRAAVLAITPQAPLRTALSLASASRADLALETVPELQLSFTSKDFSPLTPEPVATVAISLASAAEPTITVLPVTEAAITVNPAPQLLISSLGAGGFGFTWKGEWSARSLYFPYDVVQYGVGSYVALTINSNRPPGSSSDWNLLATGTPGPQGPSSQIIWGEVPGGVIDGINKNYTSSYPYSPNRLAVLLNGLRLRRTDDYFETGSRSFSFLNAPLPGDSLSIDYVQP